MKASDIPSKFPIPFADSAGGGFVRTIPEASQIGIQNGAASLEDGFPPLTFLPVGSGGVPPFGQDFNGLLKQITQWSQWQGAGALVTYDSGFSTAIGGYPQGTLLASTTAGNLWLCTADDNTTNPDSGGSNWVQIPAASMLKSLVRFGVGGGTADVITTTLSPAITAYYDGLVVELSPGAANATTTPTLNCNGVGAITIVRNDGSACQPGDLRANVRRLLSYDATNTKFQILGLFTQSTYNEQIFTSSGNFTVPAGVYKLALVQVWGAGGQGGGAASTGAGSGAWGGTYARKANLAVNPGDVIAITVGSGGSTGGGSANGQAGGASSVGSLISCPGGTGGLAGVGAGGVPAASPASPTGGDLNLIGPRPSSGNLGNFSPYGGSGASSPFGGAGSPPLSTGSAPLANAAGYPGGGGSGAGSLGPSFAGGPGQDGLVIITW